MTVVMVVSDSSDGSNSETKLKKSNCDKTQKLKVRPNTKINNVTKFKNSNCEKTIKKIKLRQNLKTQIVTKLKNPNCEKLKIQLLYWQN